MEEKSLRPLFHINGGVGWINDPNGLIKYKGLYHAFFQYYPNDVNWGPMHWGHRISEDLIHWKELPVALFPKEYSNEDGCFSGTALVYNDVLYVIYTGFYENEGNDTIRQVQCLALSNDGINFEKKGIIVGDKDLPIEYNPCDFRDPKVWAENDMFYMLVAARKKEGKGHILLFKSKDLYKWNFVSDILNHESKGTMIECPDYIKNLNLLLYSEQFQPAEGKKHLNIHTTRYAYGKFNNENRFDEEHNDIVDYGFDFYAGQTFANENIMMGWLNMWDRNNPTSIYGFAGQLTIPRHIEVANGKLIQKPVWDYSNQIAKEVAGTIYDKMKHGAIKLQIKNLESLNIKLRQKDEQCFKVTLNENELIFDRSKMKHPIIGVEKDEDSLNGIRRMPINNLEDVTIEIILDEFSLEFFVNGLAASFVVCNDIDADAIILDVKASKCEYIKSLYQ